MKCLVCQSDSKKIYDLPSEKIRKNLSDYYSEKVPEVIKILDYQMFECTKCSLVFANPASPGNNEFYVWISRHNSYYPTARWEWDLLLDYIQINSSKKLLEIGSGDGKFLRLCVEKYPEKFFEGIDTNPEQVVKCKKLGINCYCGELKDYSKTHKNKFDLIVAFHCLEHVDDPLELIKQCKKMLNKNGKILISTPFRLEKDFWFDIMDHPPHHLTRWNKSAYTELAHQANLKSSFYMPFAPNSLVRALYATFVKFYGKKEVSKKMLIVSMLRHPLFFFSCFLGHLLIKSDFFLEKENGKFELKRFKPNTVVLVELGE